jgi:acetyltransferase-like isoleucine patch superfamily enzyme
MPPHHSSVSIGAVYAPTESFVPTDVWLGYGSAVLPSVRIGHGVIMAAKLPGRAAVHGCRRRSHLRARPSVRSR